MARAGVSYTWGRESTTEYNESLAGIRLDLDPRAGAPYDERGALLPGVSVRANDLTPGAGDRKVMNYNFRLSFTKNPANRVPIPPPADYRPERYALLRRFFTGEAAEGRAVKLTDILDFYSRPNGKYEVNNKQRAIISIGHFGGQFNYPDAGYSERDAIYEDHKQYTLGLLTSSRTIRPCRRPSAPRCALGIIERRIFRQQQLALLPVRPWARRMKVAICGHAARRAGKPAQAGLQSGSLTFIDSHHVQRVAVSPTACVNGDASGAWATRTNSVPQPRAPPVRVRQFAVPVAASSRTWRSAPTASDRCWMIGGHAAGVAPRGAKTGRRCSVRRRRVTERVGTAKTGD